MSIVTATGADGKLASAYIPGAGRIIDSVSRNTDLNITDLVGIGIMGRDLSVPATDMYWLRAYIPSAFSGTALRYTGLKIVETTAGLGSPTIALNHLTSPTANAAAPMVLESLMPATSIPRTYQLQGFTGAGAGSSNVATDSVFGVITPMYFAALRA